MGSARHFGAAERSGKEILRLPGRLTIAGAVILLPQMAVESAGAWGAHRMPLLSFCCRNAAVE